MTFREEVIWLAGLLEGEGSFGLQKDGVVHIQLGMTDRDIVERARVLLRATCRIHARYQPKGTKEIYKIGLTGPRAVGWCLMLYPFLGERRQARIREVLAHWRRRRVSYVIRMTCFRGHPLVSLSGRRRRGRHKRHCPICESLRNKAQRDRRAARRAPGSNQLRFWSFG